MNLFKKIKNSGYKFGYKTKDYLKEDKELFKGNKVYKKSVIADTLIISMVSSLALGFGVRLLTTNKNVKKNTKEIVYLKQDMSDLQKQIGSFEELMKDGGCDFDSYELTFLFGDSSIYYDSCSDSISYVAYDFNSVDLVIPTEMFGKKVKQFLFSYDYIPDNKKPMNDRFFSVSNLYIPSGVDIDIRCNRLDNVYYGGSFDDLINGSIYIGCETSYNLYVEGELLEDLYVDDSFNSFNDMCSLKTCNFKSVTIDCHYEFRSCPYFSEDLRIINVGDLSYGFFEDLDTFYSSNRNCSLTISNKYKCLIDYYVEDFPFLNELNIIYIDDEVDNNTDAD